MKIVVVGGGGRIGSRLVTILTGAGHDVLAASRRTGVDAVTGKGLADALRGASVVVDVSDSPSFDDAAVLKFFTAGTRNLLAGEAAAGVGHHVMLSVVGIERLQQGGYFRAKCAQERLIKTSPVPYSIVRATQFFEFLGSIADASTRNNAVGVPPAFIQPIAADDVARAVAKVSMQPPAYDTVDLGGPEMFTLGAVIRRVLAAHHDPRAVISDRQARYFGAELTTRSLIVDPDAALGTTRFDDWLRLATPAAATVDDAVRGVEVLRASAIQGA